MRSPFAIAMLIATLASSALAMSSGDAPSTPSTSATPNAYDQAVQLVRAENYEAAVPLLEGFVAVNPAHADAWNQLGYSQRKLGRLEPALASYGRALSLEPEHRGANEYLGELHLEMGDLAKAKQRLAVLDKACWLPCEEYTELKEMIEAYESGRKAKSS